MINLTMEVVRKKAGKKAVVGEVSAIAQNLVVSGNGYGGYLLLIEIKSEAVSARKAMWAHLMRRRVATSSDAPDRTNITWSSGEKSETLSLAAKTKYTTVELDDSIIVMHPNFKKESRRYILGGDMDTPSMFFAESLRINSNIPFMEKHVPKLWQIAIEEGAVTSTQNYGKLTVWKVEENIHNMIVPRLKEVVSDG